MPTCHAAGDAGWARESRDRKASQPIGPRHIALAASVAGTVSGAPSTLWALATGGDLLEATRAAGTLLPGRQDRPGVVAGGAVHAVVSVFWTTALAVLSQHRSLRARHGALLGLAIATLDLSVIGRWRPAIRALPAIPQWLDHAAFGAVVAAVLGRHDQRSGGQRRRR